MSKKIVFSFSKISLTLLMLSLPANSMVLEQGGNLYLTTVMVLVLFFVTLIISNGSLIGNKMVFVGSLVLLLTLLSTAINVLVYNEFINAQIAKSIVYIQNLMSFSLMLYFLKFVSQDFFLKLFVFIIFLVSLRVAIEEPNHIFKLSVLRGERIESLFVAGVNTFAIFSGICALIGFFFYKKQNKRVFITLTFFFVVILTMSRGGLIASLITLFIVALYDTNRNTLKKLVRYSFYGVSLGIFILILLGDMSKILELLQNRFLSIFDSDTSLDTFFAGRFTLIEYTLEKMGDSHFLQLLFGHGNGSIDFTIAETGQNFKTTHLVALDVFYRNGLVVVFLYIILQIALLFRFLRNRNKRNLVLFGIFVFFHLELLVNPMIFSAQAGWVYFVFLAIFLRQDTLIIKSL